MQPAVATMHRAANAEPQRGYAGGMDQDGSSHGISGSGQRERLEGSSGDRLAIARKAPLRAPSGSRATVRAGRKPRSSEKLPCINDLRGTAELRSKGPWVAIRTGGA